MKETDSSYWSALFGETIDEPLYYEESVGWGNVFAKFLLALVLLSFGMILLTSLFVHDLLEGQWASFFLMLFAFLISCSWMLAYLACVFIWGFIEMALIDARTIIYAQGIKLRLDSSGLTYYEDKSSCFKAWNEISDIGYINFPTKKEKFNRSLAITFTDGIIYKVPVSETKKFKAKFENCWLVYNS